MDASLLKSKKRGKYFQLMYDEKPIEIPIKNCCKER